MSMYGRICLLESECFMHAMQKLFKQSSKIDFGLIKMCILFAKMFCFTFSKQIYSCQIVNKSKFRKTGGAKGNIMKVVGRYA